MHPFLLFVPVGTFKQLKLRNISEGVVIGFSTCYISPRCFEAANHHEPLNEICIQSATYVIIAFRQTTTEIDKKKVLAIDERAVVYYFSLLR